MAKAEHLKRYRFNAESGRAARVGQPVAPRTLHGLTEVVRGGKRRCHPPKCVKAHCCSAAQLPEDSRPEHCLALERHLRACELSLRRSLPVTPGVNAALLGIILRREQLLAVAGWWLSETEPFERGEDGRLTAQAVVDQYRGLLREQARDLQAKARKNHPLLQATGSCQCL